ncbi:MAG: RidA family protein, partial [Planctomycetaceae bacterium]|nr:RidA family protein [Planctomycetaceae bacterium]
MSVEQKAAELGLVFEPIEPGYLNLCIRSGNLLMTSGHVSDQKGKLGENVSVEEGQAAARDCAIKILRSVRDEHGTLDG